MIISVLHDLVDCVFEVVDVRLVVPDDISVRLNGLLDDTLSQSEVLDHVTETSIDIVIFRQSLVH